jgi:hypothetical protein
MSPFESGCVVLNQGGSPNYGICFKLSPREEVCAPYGQLQWASIDGTGELVIQFNQRKVIIRGRRLQPLVEQLAQQKVMSIRVAARNELLTGAGEGSTEPVIESITFEENE